MKGKSKLKIDRDKIDKNNFIDLPDGTLLLRESIIGFSEKNRGVLFLQQGWIYYSKKDFYEIAAKFFFLK